MVYADFVMVTNSDRLAALQRLCLLDTPVDPSFDRLTRLASRMIKAPVSLVTLVDRDRQFFKSQIGLPEPWATMRETPLSHSFCQHVVDTNKPLIINDSRIHPLVSNNLAITDLNVIAYAGMPLVTSDGYAIGSLCVIDHEPRVWTSEEIEILDDLAESVMTEIQLRESYDERHRIEQKLYETSQTQLKEMETLYKRVSDLERMKTEMIRVAAHDLRNPLGLVMGYSELMLEETEVMAEHHVEFVQSILRSGQKMLKLINDILSLERVTSAQNNQYQPLVFTDLAREVYDTNLDAARSANLHYTFESEDLPLTVLGDVVQLREALENLISNAIKYTPAGGTVTVRVRRQSEHILFQVEDSGYGIPEADQTRLFQAFYRVHTDETYRIAGTGLGLHLVKNIIDRHAGEVVFKSVYQKGSMFGFFLPIA